jgi:3-hydroxybutyrate dehydrogenase
MGMTGLFAVTGGGSGIGRGVCRRLAADGVRVAVLDMNGDAADEVAKEVGGEAHVLDVSDPARVARGPAGSALSVLRGGMRAS